MPAGSDGNLKIGSNDIDALQFGNGEVDAVYFGDKQVWINAVAPVMSAISNRSVAYNGAFSFDVGAITTGTAPITYTATGLPSGVTINSGTGVISGQSTSSGGHSVTVTATNAVGSASRSFTLTVGVQPIIRAALTITGPSVVQTPVTVQFTFTFDRDVTGFLQHEIFIPDNFRYFSSLQGGPRVYTQFLTSPSVGSGERTIEVGQDSVLPGNFYASYTFELE